MYKDLTKDFCHVLFLLNYISNYMTKVNYALKTATKEDELNPLFVLMERIDKRKNINSFIHQKVKCKYCS